MVLFSVKTNHSMSMVYDAPCGAGIESWTRTPKAFCGYSYCLQEAFFIEKGSGIVDKDRTQICKIISEMLDNPDKQGIYPTSTAYMRLEHYIEQERMQALGWTHINACMALDKGVDPRTICIPSMIESARKDLAS